ncbi:hypothetical protein [Tsuneonella sp. SYSU-LHT278]|uniref:hypothetical protein n=1 Tax=Tsuneonella sediminis TaxID=3416089 RepID=UPI003F79AFAD
MKRTLVAGLLLGASGICPADPLAAQHNDDEIVVSGELEEAEREVVALTRAITRRPRVDKPISRRYQQMCLGVRGLSPEFAHVLIGRIEDNARALDVPVGGTGCSINTLVYFTANTRAQIAQLRKGQPEWFDSLLDYEYERILRGNGAVQSWHSTRTKGSDGKEFAVALIGNPPREVETGRQWKATRFAQQIRVDIEGSIVLFDTRYVPGKSIQQLADYATMRLLAPTDDVSGRAAGEMETILSLFAPGGDAPDGLTPFDRAYLGALYALPPTARGEAMRDATWAAYRRARYAAPSN